MTTLESADQYIGDFGVVEKTHVLGLFKNVQMQGAQKTEPRGVYEYTLSGAVCSATQQMSVFQQPHFIKTLGGQK